MSPDALTMTFQLIFGTGGIGAIIAGIVSLSRAHQDGEQLRDDLQARMQERAYAMLEMEGLRVDQAMARAQEAENLNEETRKRLRKLERAFDSYQREMDIERRKLMQNLDEVYSWIEAGAKPPPPARPIWLKGPNYGF